MTDENPTNADSVYGDADGETASAANPASAPPIGTPVCLIENTSGARRGVENRAKICELAGVDGPMPMPSINATGTINQITPKLNINVPHAAPIRQTWLARSGPTLIIVLPAALEAKNPIP